jgi:uncharacterized protein YndB with AHSA1/START domain
MKVVKIILGIVVGVLVLLFIGSFFIPTNFRVSQTQVVKASPEAIYEQLITAEDWKNWSYWESLDPDNKITYNDTKSGVGSAYSWKSEKKELGSGTLTVAEVEPNKYVKINLDFDGKGNGFGEYVLKTVDGGTEVTSSFNSETKGFMDKWMSRLMGKTMMKKAFTASMDNMGKYLADHPALPPTPPVTDSAMTKPK